MTFSPQANADGSATMQQGLTTVSATVFGPREPKGQSRSLVHHDKAFISVEVGEAAWAQQGGSKRTRGDKWVVFLLDRASANKETKTDQELCFF